MNFEEIWYPFHIKMLLSNHFDYSVLAFRLKVKVKVIPVLNYHAM